MKCENAVDLIVDSLMDSLDEEQRKDLSAHIQSCESCAAEAEKMSAIWKGLGELRAPGPAPQAAFEFGRRLSAERSRRRYTPLFRAAASIALLLLGAAGGSFLARGDGSPPIAQPTGAPTFLLLVRGAHPEASVPGERLVQEYREWASSLADEGRLAGANKLTDEPGRWLSGSAAEGRTRSDIQGYFLVHASSYSEALEIAGASPHIRYGGTFEIRQIDPVN